VVSTFVVLFTLIIDYSTAAPIVKDSLKTQNWTRTRIWTRVATTKGTTRLFRLLRTRLCVCLVKLLTILIHSQVNQRADISRADSEDNDATYLQDDGDDVMQLFRRISLFWTPISMARCTRRGCRKEYDPTKNKPDSCVHHLDPIVSAAGIPTRMPDQFSNRC
jgi:CHORD